jgi:hypothetical protein
MALSDGPYPAHGRDGAEAGWTAGLDSSRRSSPSEHEQRSRCAGRVVRCAGWPLLRTGSLLAHGAEA